MPGSSLTGPLWGWVHMRGFARSSCSMYLVSYFFIRAHAQMMLHGLLLHTSHSWIVQVSSISSAWRVSFPSSKVVQARMFLWGTSIWYCCIRGFSTLGKWCLLPFIGFVRRRGAPRELRSIGDLGMCSWRGRDMVQNSLSRVTFRNQLHCKKIKSWHLHLLLVHPSIRPVIFLIVFFRCQSTQVWRQTQTQRVSALWLWWKHSRADTIRESE